ncbi:hypothetical protein [Streptomyces axinellae]|uniref:AG1 protein n=1 Tax=Streptomyces axinellae TaxID=552788 RepID=A0ABP6C0S1_9ACTN
MSWAEWDHAKANATAGEGGTRMRLNGYTAADHPGDGPRRDLDLVVHDDELGKLGNMAHGLRKQLGTDGKHAQKATSDAAGDLAADGFDMGDALSELHGAWETKVKTLQDACGQISDHLDYTRGAHSEDEGKIKGAMSSIATLDKRIK